MFAGSKRCAQRVQDRGPLGGKNRETAGKVRSNNMPAHALMNNRSNARVHVCSMLADVNYHVMCSKKATSREVVVGVERITLTINVLKQNSNASFNFAQT